MKVRQTYSRATVSPRVWSYRLGAEFEVGSELFGAGGEPDAQAGRIQLATFGSADLFWILVELRVLRAVPVSYRSLGQPSYHHEK
jgi:hypothetical protein